MNISRRNFIKDAAFASLFAAAGCQTTAHDEGLSVAGIRIGVQMWSVNDLWKKDPADAFRRLRALGYTGVQSFGFYDMNWNELEKMLNGEGLRVVDMPFYMKTLADGGESRFLDFCERFKVDFVYEPYTSFKSGADWKAHVKELVAISQRFAARGIRVGYHNHQHEVRERFERQSPLDMLVEGGLAFELDVGHVKLAGGDPVAWLERLPKRVPTIHAKPGGGNSVGGEGDANDWKAIFRAASAAGTKWAVVECETRRDTYADVEATMDFLRSLRA